MVNPNSWYIARHLDKLNQDLLDDYGKDVEDKSQKNTLQTKNKTEMNRVDDNHGF